MNSNIQNTIPTTPRSSVAAGLLGIFLGSFGAHNWYLGQKQKGIIHLCILGGGFLLSIIGGVMAGLGAASAIASYRVSGSSAVLAVIGGIISVIGSIAIWVNSIWGLVEGIMILVKGDAGLAAQGYTVATVAAQPAQPAQPAAPAAKPAEKTETKSEKTAK